MRYRIYTLVDITNTKQYRIEGGKECARYQQQNFDTVIQTIGLRSNLEYDTPPTVLIGVPKDYGLDGSNLENIWMFEWFVEMEYIFLKDNDDVGFLKTDFDLVPYIPGLTETFKMSPAIFKPGTNISFEMLDKY